MGQAPFKDLEMQQSKNQLERDPGADILWDLGLQAATVGCLSPTAWAGSGPGLG